MIVLALAAVAAATGEWWSGSAYLSPAPKQAPVVASMVYVESLPGVTVGTATATQRATNSMVINAHLARGEELRLHAGTRIEIGQTLKVASGGSIVGDVGPNKPVIYMPAAAFNNTSNDGDRRYGPHAVGIDFSGLLGGSFRPSVAVNLQNIRVVSEQRTGRYLRAIVGRNVTDCSIRNVEISGFPIAIGVALASARGCRIDNVYIHDFADNSAWEHLPQSTGIEIDNDVVNGIGSSDNRIEHFRIERLELGPTALARWGYQTDGINVLSSAVRTSIANGRISTVGEGIDTFGSDGTITNVSISDTYNFGLKFIHGASRNRVEHVAIINPGLAGITISGSDVALQNTAGNLISDVRIANVDPDSAWRGHATAGILISGRNMRRVPVANRVVNAEIDLGERGEYGWLDDSTGSGNRGTGIRVRAGRSLERRVLVLHNGSSVVLSPPP